MIPAVVSGKGLVFPAIAVVQAPVPEQLPTVKGEGADHHDTGLPHKGQEH